MGEKFLGSPQLHEATHQPNQPTKMKIKINLANNGAINAALDKINGKATSFTITCTLEVLDIVKAAEAKLAILPKADRKGAKVMYRPAGPSANSYKYSAKSTRIYIERGSNDWFLTNVQPDAVQPKGREMMSITITNAQAAEIQRRAIADFYVTPAA